MKNTYLFIISLIAFNLISCENYTKKTTDDIEEISKSTKSGLKDNSIKNQLIKSHDLEKKWLIDFYISYIRFYINSSNGKDKPKMSLFFKELDSIKKQNSIQSFYKIQTKDFNKDFDYITNNEFICEQSLTSLKINKKEGLENTYAVSFIAEYPLNEKESEYKKINFDVKVVNENGKYKISKTCCF